MAVHTLSTPVTPTCTENSLNLCLEKPNQTQETHSRKLRKLWSWAVQGMWHVTHLKPALSGSKHGSELPVITLVITLVTYCFTWNFIKIIILMHVSLRFKKMELEVVIIHNKTLQKFFKWYFIIICLKVPW